MYKYHVFEYGNEFDRSKSNWDLIEDVRRASLNETEKDRFLDALRTYQEWGKRDKYELVFHVFADHTDEWIEEPLMAYAIYKRFEKEKGNARLYVELYEDRENDEMVHEDCLLSAGDYPS